MLRSGGFAARWGGCTSEKATPLLRNFRLSSAWRDDTGGKRETATLALDEENKRGNGCVTTTAARAKLMGQIDSRTSPVPTCPGHKVGISRFLSIRDGRDLIKL